MRAIHVRVRVAPVRDAFEPWWPWELRLLKSFIIAIIISFTIIHYYSLKCHQPKETHKFSLPSPVCKVAEQTPVLARPQTAPNGQRWGDRRPCSRNGSIDIGVTGLIKFSQVWSRASLGSRMLTAITKPLTAIILEHCCCFLEHCCFVLSRLKSAHF